MQMAAAIPMIIVYACKKTYKRECNKRIQRGIQVGTKAGKDEKIERLHVKRRNEEQGSKCNPQRIRQVQCMDNTPSTHGGFNQWNKDYTDRQDEAKDVGIHDGSVIIIGILMIVAIPLCYTGQNFIDRFNVKVASQHVHRGKHENE